MRIGVNTLFLIPGAVGGSETYLREVLRAAWPRHPDVTWVLFTNRENDAGWRDLTAGAAGRIACVPLNVPASNRFARILKEQTALPRRARLAGVDVLWSPGYTAPLWAAMPQAVSVLDMQYREFPQDLSPLARLVTGVLVPGAIRRCCRVLTLSAFSRDQILRYVPVAPDRIAVTPLGVTPAFGTPQPAAERQARLARLIPGTTRYLLCVANTYPHKNVAALVRAYGRLQNETPCDLVLNGGPGRGEDDVQRALHELGGTPRIRRLNRLTPADLVAIYQGAEAFVFPSLYEGFGLPVLEAMSAGIPALAVARASVPEIGGDCINYCDGTTEGLTGRLRELLRLSDSDRRALVARARHRAAGFSWDRTADATVACLGSAAQSR